MSSTTKDRTLRVQVALTALLEAIAAEKAELEAWTAAVPEKEWAFRAVAEGRCWNCLCKTADASEGVPMCKECQVKWS